jgi:hypothetical protein
MKYLAVIVMLLSAGFANAQTGDLIYTPNSTGRYTEIPSTQPGNLQAKTRTFYVEELTPAEYKKYTEAKKNLDDAKEENHNAEVTIRKRFGDRNASASSGTVWVGYSGSSPARYTTEDSTVEIKENYALVTTNSCVITNSGYYNQDCKQDFTVKELSETQIHSLDCTRNAIDAAQAKFDQVVAGIRTSHVAQSTFWTQYETEVRGKYLLITVKHYSGATNFNPGLTITYN